MKIFARKLFKLFLSLGTLLFFPAIKSAIVYKTIYDECYITTKRLMRKRVNCKGVIKLLCQKISYHVYTKAAKGGKKLIMVVELSRCSLPIECLDLNL